MQKCCVLSAKVFCHESKKVVLCASYCYFCVYSKAVNKIYEEFVLTEGDFDERVFLCDDADIELGTPIKGQPPEIRRETRRDASEQFSMVSNMGHHFCGFDLRQHIILC